MTAEPARDPFPAVDEYAWNTTCMECGAVPGTACENRRGLHDHHQINRFKAAMGKPPRPMPRYGFPHRMRVAAAELHRDCDIANAPAPEDQVDGVRYDTLPVPRLPQP